MLASSIGWMLVVSGTITMAGGLTAFFLPKLLLQMGFEEESPASILLFFIRHWGVLVVTIGLLIAYSAYAPAIRVPVLLAAAIEKFALALMVFSGFLKTTRRIKAAALLDGFFALLYLIYLFFNM